MSKATPTSQNPPCSTTTLSQDAQIAIHMAWSSLQQRLPAEACEYLLPYAEDTRIHRELAEVWSAMLGFNDDSEQLSHEIKRLARYWSHDAPIVLRLAEAAYGLLRRRPQLHPPERFDGTGLAALAEELVNYCLDEHPPSAPIERAQLHLIRAQLYSLGSIHEEDKALDDLQQSTHLDPSSYQPWFTLSQIHLQAGRWTKARESALHAKSLGLTAPPLWWTLAMCATAEGNSQLQLAREAWATLDHGDLLEGSDGRLVKADYARCLVTLSPSISVPENTTMTHIDEYYTGLSKSIGSSKSNGSSDSTWSTEIVWAQPLSPCHGRILNPSYGTYPADLDDLVIWSPHPLSFEKVEGEERPVFQVIACLSRGQARSIPMNAAQLSEAQLSEINMKLPKGINLIQPSSTLEIPFVTKLVYPAKILHENALDILQNLWTQLQLPTLDDSVNFQVLTLS